MNLPVIDLHCDLLSYLSEVPNADPLNKEDIGCALPFLREGNVILQVMAIYTATEHGSSQSGLKQSKIFRELPRQYHSYVSLLNKKDEHLNDAFKTTGIIAAIENASGFCEEDEPIESGFKNLETIISNTGRILYIGLTHHGENRFGGGNTTRIGLKEDGRALLDYISGKKIALDLSHASDSLAYEIFDYMNKKKLDLPVIASHSNFRNVFLHNRNLPDDIAKEIINRKGLIGMNFLRAFLNNDDPGALYDHILHGLKLNGENALCFGADYFYTAHHPDQSRRPFFHHEHKDAGCYPSILKNLEDLVTADQLKNISYRNVSSFIDRIWFSG